MSRDWSKGSSRAWRKLRRQVLERDRYRCQLELPGCTTRATTVHHTAGKSVTGDDPKYLVAACRSCNLKVGSPSRHDPSPRPWSGW